jgi:Mrp family chromosome partitioning ATPase
MNTYDSVFKGLIYNLLQQPRADADKGMVLCFTSAQPGEGVTHVVRALANELGTQAPERVARVDLAYLQTSALLFSGSTALSITPMQDDSREMREDAFDTSKSNLQLNWHGNRQHRRDRISGLRSHFDYVLIDCPSLRTSADVLGIAPLVDGVLLVVEANRTQPRQILHAERQIEAAGGLIRGHILNKRKYFVPNWLYRRLSGT